MKIRTKLIALLLAISLIPGMVIGVAGVQNMNQIGDYAQEQSTQQLESQITGELNTTVSARQEEIHNLLAAREVDGRSLAQDAAVQKYHAADHGEMKLVQRQSQQQLGYMAIQMHESIENTKQRVLEEQYDGREYDDLSPAEQQAVKTEVERILVGTAGNGIQGAGAFSTLFQPGYIGNTGYFYITDIDSNVVAHHSLDDGYNLVEDAGGTLTVFRDIKSNIQSSPEIRTGETWGVAEYDWEDTTQEGNPIEEKFISYTYYEDFDWIIAPNVYYYELQTTAVEDARTEITASFESYLETRTIAVGGTERPAYKRITMVDAEGNGMVQTARTEDGEIQSQSIEDESFASTQWFQKAKGLKEGEVAFGEVHMEDGSQVMRVLTPVYYDGEFVGAISLAFDYEIISAVTNDVTVGESGYLSIVNEDGTVVSHPDASVVESGQRISDTGYAGGLATLAESRILDGETGLNTYSQESDSGEQSFYVGYAPIDVGQKEFHLLATVPKEDVTAPIAALAADMNDRTDSARNFFLLLFGGIALAVLAIGYKMSEYFADPIKTVRDRALSLAEGDLDTEVETASRDDEIGELLDSFARMQENLRTVFDDLDELSHNLGSGELDGDLQTDYPGTYGHIMEQLDDGTTQLRSSFGEIRSASDGLQSGTLDQTIDTDKPGEYGAVLDSLDTGTDQLSESFDQILRASEGLRDGRLDQEFQTDLPGAYGRALVDLEAGFEGVNDSIAEVQTIANTVADTSQEVATSTAEIERASQEVAESVQEISHGAENQSENLQQAAGELNDLSATVEEIASAAAQVAENASMAVEKGETGRENSTEATDEIEAIESEAEEAVTKVSDLDAEMEQIGEIIQMIDEIAEQTNLLALNASIEAARAGEAGEGFAVVADEIKSLAAEAGEATDEIAERIATVQSSTSETVESIEEMRARVERGADTIDATIEMFDEIAVAIEEVEDGVTEISEATDDQATSTEEVVAMVDEVSSVAEETAAEASNVSAASEEQTSSLSEVGNNVDDLSAVAEELDELVDQFEVDGTATQRRHAAASANTPAVSDGGEPNRPGN